MQALGFHIWVAELELLVGQTRGPKQSVDPVAAMELLQKLQVTIESSDKARIREYQRRCEDALENVLLKGTAPPVCLKSVPPHSPAFRAAQAARTYPPWSRSCVCVTQRPPA